MLIPTSAACPRSQNVAEWHNLVAYEFGGEQRRALAGLYNTVEGCDVSLLASQGLAEMLESLTTPLPSWPDRVYLRSHFHRAALAVSRTWVCLPAAGCASLVVKKARMLHALIWAV